MLILFRLLGDDNNSRKGSWVNEDCGATSQALERMSINDVLSHSAFLCHIVNRVPTPSSGSFIMGLASLKHQMNSTDHHKLAQ